MISVVTSPSDNRDARNPTVTRHGWRLDWGAVQRLADSTGAALGAAGDRRTDDSPAFEKPAPRAAGRFEFVEFAAVGFAAAALFAFHLGSYGLWEPDEARYAEIAREMLLWHDWIVPHLNYVPYIEKPPLLYWLTALSMRIFGINEFAARFINAAAALAGVLATYVFTRRTFGRDRALLAATVLATSGLYAVMAQVLTTDMLLTAAITAALFAFYLHWREGGRWWLLCYGAIGAGMLTKGPIGVAIPVLVGMIFLWWEEGWAGLRRAPRRFHIFAGATLSIAIAVPWFIAITIRQPDFLNFYFVGENLRRAFVASYDHSQPFYYYVPVIAAGMLPWTLAAPFIPWRSLPPNPTRRFCMIAALSVFGLFSLAHSKLIPYVLPALPPIAILIADGLLQFNDAALAARDHSSLSQPDRQLLALLGVLLALAGVGIEAIALAAHRIANPYPLMVRPALIAAGAILIIGGAACYAGFRRRTISGVGIFAATGAAVLIVVSYGRLLAEPSRSYAQLAREVARKAPDSALVCYPRYIQSLPFYSGRRVILVGAKTELAYGAEHAADAAQFFFTRRADLLRLWNAKPPPVLILDRSALPPIASSLGPYTVIASDQKKLAIERRVEETPDRAGESTGGKASQ